MTHVLLLALLLASATPRPEDAGVAKGVAQFEAGEFALSQATLQRALAKAAPGEARARAHLYRGLALASLDKAAAAEAEFVAALRDDPLVEPDPTRVKERLARQFREARDKLTGVLEVQADRVAIVRVDGVAAGTAPRVQPTRVGRHTVDAASTDGAWRSEVREAVVPVDGKVVVSLALEPVLGTLRLTSTPPGAQVSVDGAERGPAPLELQLLVGQHELRAVLPTGEAWQESVPVAEGAVTVRNAVLGSPAPLPQPVLAPPPPLVVAAPAREGAPGLAAAGVALAVVGGLGLVGAGVFAVLGDRQNGAIKAGGFARLEDLQAAASLGEAYNAAGYSCLAGGVAVLGSGIALLVVGARGQPGITLAPTAGPGGAGMVLRGVWP